MNFLMRHKLLSAALIIEIILLLIPVVKFFGTRYYLDMAGNDIPLAQGIYADGPYIDEDFESSGYFTYGPGVDLARGVYDIIIDYDTDGYYMYRTDMNMNYVMCMADDATLTSLRYGKPIFEPGNNQLVFTVWVEEDIHNFQITTIYSGEGYLKIDRIQIAQSYQSYTLDFFRIFVGGMIINAIILLWERFRRRGFEKKNVAVVLALTAITLFMSYPVLVNYTPSKTDAQFHLLRIEGIKDGLLSGQFPVKIQPTQFYGAGFAASVMYGDLFLYIPAILRIIGFPIHDAYMFYVIMVNLATAWVSYFCFKHIFHDEKAALFGSAVYSMNLYRVFNLHQRSAVGEYTAMIFLPLLVLGLYKIFTDDCGKKEYGLNWIIPTIAFTGIMESHVLYTVIAGMFTIILCCILWRRVFRKNCFLVLMKTVVATLLVNLGFIIPFIQYYTGNVCKMSEGIMAFGEFQQHGLYISQLFSTFQKGDAMISQKARFGWGMVGEASPTLGIVFVAFVVLFLYFYLTKEVSRWMPIAKTAFLIAVISISFSLLYFPWTKINMKLNYFFSGIQFSWRFIGITAIALTVVAVCIYLFLSKNVRIQSCFVALALGIIVISDNFYMDELMFGFLDADYIYSASDLELSGCGTPSVEYAPYGAPLGKYTVRGVITSSEQLVYEDYQKHYLDITAKVYNQSNVEQYIEFPIFYYPEIVANDENGSLECISGTDCMAHVIVPAGYEGVISVGFRQPFLWIVGYVISALSVLGIIICFCWSKCELYEKKYNKK